MKRIYLIFFAVFVLLLIVIGIYETAGSGTKIPFPAVQKIKTILQKSGKTTNPSTIYTVVVIMMENKSYSDIVGSPNAPYINSLIHTYSFADNYFAVTHPSLPNYIALLGGNTFGITSDCTDCHVNAANFIDQLEQVNKTWEAYMESIPFPCFAGSSGKYAQKHDPFLYFDDIRNNAKRCHHIVPYSFLSSDFRSLNSTPHFAWITPDLCDDMHDCSVQTGDRWLASNVSYILASPAFTKHKSMLAITWDEGEGSGSNRVPLLLIGNAVKHGFTSHTSYSHYSLLHTIEQVWHLPPITQAVSQSKSMTDMLLPSLSL
ncbi:MAG TPA: alkaline phosphatase family protein [Patescibacteria group bacterium]|nr:alkaline phosphatase family protein [Patescibacteria group bacterium]